MQSLSHIQTLKAKEFSIVCLIILINIFQKSHIVHGNFPINDGGLFVVMTNNVIENNFILPSFTDYNQLNIPFSYPPLAFYFAASATVLSNYSTLKSLIYIPFLFNLLIPILVYILFRKLKVTQTDALAGTLIYTLLPRSYSWLIMGGGLTRATGLLTALIVLILLISKSIYLKKQIKIVSSLFLALTILTHLEMSIFLLSSLIIFTLFKKISITHTTFSLIVSLLLISPWLIFITKTHTIIPFLYAFQSGEWNPVSALFQIFSLSFMDESYLPLYSLISIVGFIQFFKKKFLMLPLWFIFTLITNQRGGSSLSVIPFSLISAYGLKIIKNTAAKYLIVFLFITISIVNLAIQTDIKNKNDHLNPLSQSSIQAMEWISKNISHDAKFIVISSKLGSTNWFTNKESEWFPALSQAKSINTVQGSEWLPINKSLINLNTEINTCTNKSVSCLEEVHSPRGSYDYIYLSKNNDSFMLNSIFNDPKYKSIYTNNSVTILKRL